jgi:hypothetical protein
VHWLSALRESGFPQYWPFRANSRRAAVNQKGARLEVKKSGSPINAGIENPLQRPLFLPFLPPYMQLKMRHFSIQSANEAKKWQCFGTFVNALSTCSSRWLVDASRITTVVILSR